MELDYTKPIFTLYINVDNMTRACADSILKMYSDSFSHYTNLVLWIFPVRQQPTKLECVYSEKRIDLDELIIKINEKIDILSGCSNFEEFKCKLREYNLNSILDDCKSNI